jgi:hypothetical protein
MEALGDDLARMLDHEDHVSGESPKSSYVLTILHCRAIGHSRFLANGRFRRVNHAAGVGERTERRVAPYRQSP